MINFSQFCESNSVFSGHGFKHRLDVRDKKTQQLLDDYIKTHFTKEGLYYTKKGNFTINDAIKNSQGNFNFDEYPYMIVSGNVDVSLTHVTSLPAKELFIRHGNLIATGCTKLTKTPERITLEQKFYSHVNFNYSKNLEIVSKNISCDDIKLNHTNIKYLPRFVDDRAKMIFADYCDNLEEIEEGYTCDTLSIVKSKVTRIPNNLNIGTFHALQSPIKEIGSNCKFVNLFLAKTKITSIPKDLVVTGLMDIGRTPLLNKLTKEFNHNYTELYNYLKKEYKNIKDWTETR